MRKKQSPVEKWLALSEEDKQAEIARFDHLPVGPDGLPGKPLSSAKQKQWQRVQRRLKRGRPTVGKGAKRVPVSIEQGLLAKADAYAKRHNLKRSQMVAEGLRLVMGEGLM
jgi:hypothetical protein